jgi:TonB family protein
VRYRDYSFANGADALHSNNSSPRTAGFPSSVTRQLSADSEVQLCRATTVPPFPLQAISGGAVLVEMHVDRSGDVTDAVAVASAPPFDVPALAAARQWRFRPAIVGSTPTPALVYIVFGFPAPVVVTFTRPGGSEGG